MASRKPRSDKGLIMATQRDLKCIQWIADQYCARFDQIQRLLTRWPGAPLHDKLIAETTVKDQISRWKRAGWIEYKRVLADGPGFAWVSRKGLALVGLDEIYTAREPASTRLPHLYAVNQLRLWMDLQGFEWISEREYRAKFLEKGKKGESTGPIPDALISSEKTGRVAVEVELSPKKPDDLQNKLVHLVRATELSHTTFKYESKFPFIWFYVPSERIKRLIESARKHLRDDERGRVSIGVEADLTA